MKYLKLFESYNQFEIDTKRISDSDKGYFTIINILEQKKYTLESCLKIVSENLVQFGISEHDTKYKMIGAGQYGIAFRFHDKVLKLTTSKKEFDTCSKLVELDLMGVVKYYLAFQFSGLPIWVIIQDRLKKIPKVEKDVYTTLYYMGANDINNKDFKYKNKSNLFIELQKRVKNPLPEDEIPSHNVSKDELKVYFDKYFELVDKLNIEGVPTDDLHGENIGLRDGELVHFDVMLV